MDVRGITSDGPYPPGFDPKSLTRAEAYELAERGRTRLGPFIDNIRGIILDRVDWVGLSGGSVAVRKARETHATQLSRVGALFLVSLVCMYALPSWEIVQAGGIRKKAIVVSFKGR